MATVNFTPLADRVLILKIEDSNERSKGGIIIPDSAREKSAVGEVVAVGRGRKDESGKRIPLDVEVGDKVAFGKYAGSPVPTLGDEYVTMREEEILGVIAK